MLSIHALQTWFFFNIITSSVSRNTSDIIKTRSHKRNSSMDILMDIVKNINSTIIICDINFGSKFLSLDILNAVRDNHMNYAFINNYSYHHQIERIGKERSIHFTKIHLIKRLFMSPKRYDWVLVIDSDAVFRNSDIRVQDIVSKSIAKDSTSHHTPSLFFSGDSNAINAGVLLFRRSTWTMEFLDEILRMAEVLEHYQEIGMGGDNAVIAMFLGGCNSSCSYAQFQQAYLRVDVGYNHATRHVNRPMLVKVASADAQLYSTMLAPHVLPHVFPMPQEFFQSPVLESAKYVFHCPGLSQRKKENLLAKALKLVRTAI